MDDWNGDGAAFTLGQHQVSIHRYQRLEVGYMDDACSVIFSAACSTSSPLNAFLQPDGSIEPL